MCMWQISHMKTVLITCMTDLVVRTDSPLVDPSDVPPTPLPHPYVLGVCKCVCPTSLSLSLSLSVSLLCINACPYVVKVTSKEPYFFVPTVRASSLS